MKKKFGETKMELFKDGTDRVSNENESIGETLNRIESKDYNDTFKKNNN